MDNNGVNHELTARAMVLFSGGVDSTTCLGLAIERFGKENVIPLSIFYGQKHDKELEAARQVLKFYGLTGERLDLTTIFSFSNSSLLQTSEENIPQGTYAEQQNIGDSKVVSTYVPFRNGLFLAAAASMALSFQCGYIYYGAHKDDVAGNAYPDCSEVFYEAMQRSIYEGSGKELSLVAPFVNKSKADVVKEGLRLQVPYELTWSCYEGADRPCGHCATCLDRQKAFAVNGVDDPATL